jgi:hypothetical protein
MSEVSDLSATIDDGVLSEPWVIERSTGQFQVGGWVTSVINLPGYGVVSVASEQDLLMIPEGDRVTGSMIFHSTQRIYETQEDANGQQFVSDKMIWNYQTYRVMKVGTYPNRNYWRAIAVRIQGN